MNMGFWVPEANFYRQSSFLVSCQIIAQTSSQLCPGHSKADVAKHRIWGRGRDNISEDVSEVYITYILLLCTVLGPCFAHRYVCTFLIPVSKSGKLTFERIYWTLRAYRSSSNNRARSRTGRELKISLYWPEKGKKWMDSPRFIWLVSSILFEQPGQSFCSEGLLQCKCFHQGNLYWTMRETMNKMTRGMLAEETWSSWPCNHSVLYFEEKSSPASEVVWVYIWVWSLSADTGRGRNH